MEDKKQELNEVINKVRACEAEIGKAIIGQKDIVRQVLIAILAEGNVLLEGVPGLGKTELVKTIAKVLELEFSRIQFTPDLMPADVTGTNLIIKEDGGNSFRFQPGPVFANIVLADEINRATPKTQAAMLEAMQERTVTVGNTTYDMPKPYMVLATENPIENEGTYPLPEAQLDRFLYKLNITFPTKEELKEIVELTVTNSEAKVVPVVAEEDIISMSKLIKDMPIATSVMDYVMDIVVGTHGELETGANIAKKYVSNGASPRGAQAMIKTAKARALMEGRYNVSFDDIDYVAYPALRHRIITNFEALSDGITTDDIIREVINEMRPRYKNV